MYTGHEWPDSNPIEVNRSHYIYCNGFWWLLAQLWHSVGEQTDCNLQIKGLDPAPIELNGQVPIDFSGAGVDSQRGKVVGGAPEKQPKGGCNLTQSTKPQYIHLLVGSTDSSSMTQSIAATYNTAPGGNIMRDCKLSPLTCDNWENRKMLKLKD